MAYDRRRLLVGFWLAFFGLLLAFLSGLIPGVPQPPPCGTAICNAAGSADLVGVLLILVGMALLSTGLLGKGSTAAPPDAGYPPGQYSFSPTPPGPATPLRAQAPPVPSAPSVRTCPACGASITPEYGFCPRCGRTIAP
ncbi:MAG: hypothetical protein ACLQD8_00470 [Thermoplasmata archaeon]